MVNQNRQLVQIPPFTIPIDYSPNSGDRLGILVEPASTNYFVDSENLSTGVINSSGVGFANKSVSGSPKSLRFPGNDSEEYAGANISFSADAVAITFYALQDTLQRPVVKELRNKETTFGIRVNGYEINVPSSDIDVQGPMNDLSYRIRVRARLFGQSLNKIEIVKPLTNDIGCNISRIQVEKNHWTSYIPTTGSTDNRPAETIYRDLTHGVDINENQGAFDVAYSPTPGSYGSPMTLLRDDWSEYIAYGHQRNENDYPEVIRFYSSSSNLRASPLRFFEKPSNVTEKNSAIRACYSGYGVRGLSRYANSVSKLKDYDSFINGKLNRIQFGESHDGTHYCGLIHIVNGFLRALTDEEMINFEYVPNDSSSDLDFDLETPGVAVTAAAMFKTDQEAILYQNVVEPPTPQRILAAWPRTSDEIYYADPNAASGTNAELWYYDSGVDGFVMPVNSKSVEQIFSPIKLDTYEFEAVLTTTEVDQDGDFIGLVALADYIDGEVLSVVVGVEPSQMQLRPRDNSAPPIFKMAFFDQTSGYDRNSHRTKTEFLGGNNSVYGGGSITAGSPLGVSSWRHPSKDKINIKVVRQGPFLSAKISDWGGGPYLDDSEIVYNLNNLPRNGYKLLGPARYGFVMLSQNGSTYQNYEVRSEQAINDLNIYSEESNKYWFFSNNSWTLQSETATDDLLPATRINNRKTKEQFIIEDDTGLPAFNRSNGISENDGSVTVPSGQTTDILATDITSQFTFEDEELFISNVFEEQNLIAEQIVLGGQQYVRVIPNNNSNGSFVVLLETESTTNSFGITNETIAFRTINVQVT